MLLITNIISSLLNGQTLPIEHGEIGENLISKTPRECTMENILRNWIPPKDLLFMFLALSFPFTRGDYLQWNNQEQLKRNVFMNQLETFWDYFQVEIEQMEGIGILHGELRLVYDQNNRLKIKYEEIITFEDDIDGFVANIQTNNLLVLRHNLVDNFSHYVTDLNLSHTNMLNDTSFGRLVSHPMFHENVKKLDISHCFQLTLYSIETIVKKFMRLECVVFQLNQCHPKNLMMYADFFWFLCDMFETITDVDFAGCRLSGVAANETTRQETFWPAPPFTNNDNTYIHNFILSPCDLCHLLPKLIIKCDTSMPCKMIFNVFADQQLSVSLIRSMATLTELHISGENSQLTQFDDQCIIDITTNNNNFVFVSFLNCDKVTDNGIMYLVQCSVHLKMINITDCVRLTYHLKPRIQAVSQTRVVKIDTGAVYAYNDRVFQLNR